MNNDEIFQNWWSLDSNEKAINKDFDSLSLNSSSDFNNDDNIIVEKGNRERKKQILPCDSKRKLSDIKKPMTMLFVLPFQNENDCNLDLSQSSGYNSMKTSIKDCLAYNYSSEIQNDRIHAPTTIQSNVTFDKNSNHIGNLYKDSKKRQLKHLLKIRLFSKKVTKVGNEQFIFEFGDTNLIKCCRIGQVLVVENCINQLLKENQLVLINKQNFANETALSIATYNMNENMIQLLIKFLASPLVPLTMNNNVLHLAAAMTNDSDRRTLRFLINAIKHYQLGSLLCALTAKNVFNEDVCGVLTRYSDQNINDMSDCQSLQIHIDYIQSLIKMLNYI